MSFELVALPSFTDNYIWCLHDGRHALVVDPGDPDVVENWLSRHQLTLTTILVTHHHADHTAGLPRLRAGHAATTFGPDENIGGLDTVLAGRQSLDLGIFGMAEVIPVPGHTRGHIAYHLPDQHLLFAGDTLFSAGCGRLFEGTPTQMYQSLQTLTALPDETLLCCTHEYTLANLRFARAVEPDNPAIGLRQQEVETLRATGQPSLPITLGSEKRYNPFLRCHLPSIRQAASAETGSELVTEESVFAAIRAWKDRF